MKAEFFLQKIKIEFPEVKWKKYIYLTHGWDHVIIILDSKFVFRMPKKVSKDSLSNLHDEIQLLRYLKNKVRASIPDYTYLSKDKSLAGYKLVEGRELNLNLYKQLSASEKENIAKQLADFLTTLHKTPFSIAKKYNIRTETPAKLYAWQVRDIKKYIFPRLNKKEVLIIQKYLVELKAALDLNFSSALKHGDLTWEHILWDNRKKRVNIIDFSDRSLGDPASDFAGLWEYGSELVKRVYKLYRGKKDGKLLYRSQLYFKRIPLFVMKDALTGFPCTFKDGYAMFKKRFIH